MKKPPHRVLYVDDEVANLHAFQLAFEEEFDILTATSGQEALELLGRGDVGVLLTDERMPGMTGSQLCALVRAQHPEVIRMIVTAYSDIAAVLTAVNDGQVSRYFVKPWREEEMIDTLAAALEAYELTLLTRGIQARLLRKEQQATAAFLLGRVLHELGNPTLALRTNLSFLVDSISQLAAMTTMASPEAKQLAKELVPGAEEAVAIVDEIIGRIELLRRGDTDMRSPNKVGLDRPIQIAVSILRSEVSARARLVVDLKSKPQVAAEQARLTQIVVNLITNACEAIPAGNPADNTIKIATFIRGDRAGLSVEDTGTGILPQEIDKIFEPFVSTKGQGNGRGLGLAIVRDIVDRLGGTITVHVREDGRGTRFVVELPRAD